MDEEQLIQELRCVFDIASVTISNSKKIQDKITLVLDKIKNRVDPIEEFINRCEYCHSLFPTTDKDLTLCHKCVPF